MGSREGERPPTYGIPPASVRLARVLAAAALQQAERFFTGLRESRAEPRSHVKEVAAAEGDHALYVHMPFCHQPLCSFCSFVRYPFDPERSRRYLKALAVEAAWLASTAERVRVPLVYIGGGTPTVDVYGLAETIDVLRSYFGRGLAVSVEANPIDINDESVSVLRSAGVRRLSIGVQALTAERLRRLGRLSHRVGDAVRAVEAARGRFETLNIDMIWGATGDTRGTVYEEALRALRLGASQVTFYPLMPPPGRRRLMMIRGEGPWHPEEPGLYEAVLRAALEAGYQPATPWCMNRGSRLIDEYVVEYDRFLALGLSGIGRTRRYVYVNCFTPEGYMRMVERRGHAALLARRLSPVEDMLYYASAMAFGLRWCPAVLLERYGRLAAPLSATVQALLRMIGEERRGDCYRLTRTASLYTAHAMQRSLYMAVNGLREWGMAAGV